MHATMWEQFSTYFCPGDCIIAEVGTSQFGILDAVFPRDVQFFTQIYYSCIGFTVGALLGALVARKEDKKEGRVILFVGDGSLQMSVQVKSKVPSY